jgi:superfamily II DNA or RNA helicase
MATITNPIVDCDLDTIATAMVAVVADWMEPTRPHQVKALRASGAYLKRKCKRQLLVLPTGTGKTVAAARTQSVLTSKAGY